MLDTEKIANILGMEADASKIRVMVYDPATSPETLAVLAQSSTTEIREQVARHHNALPLTLVLLATDAERSVKYRVANNENTPMEAYDTLLAMEDMGTALVHSPHTPKRILEQLASHPVAGVRWMLATNANTPAHILETLSEDKDRNVRERVVFNANTPLPVLSKLSEDEDTIVSEWSIYTKAVTETKGKKCFHIVGICRKPHTKPFFPNRRICKPGNHSQMAQ